MPEVFKKTLLLKNGITYKMGATEELFTSSVLRNFLEIETNVETGKIHGYETSVHVESNLAQLLKAGV